MNPYVVWDRDRHILITKYVLLLHKYKCDTDIPYLPLVHKPILNADASTMGPKAFRTLDSTWQPFVDYKFTIFSDKCWARNT